MILGAIIIIVNLPPSLIYRHAGYGLYKWEKTIYTGLM